MRIKIAPSMVACDLAHLADSIAEVERGGADVLHVDVADGHFVPRRLDKRFYDPTAMSITPAGVKYFEPILGPMPKPCRPASLNIRKIADL